MYAHLSRSTAHLGRQLRKDAHGMGELRFSSAEFTVNCEIWVGVYLETRKTVNAFGNGLGHDPAWKE